ncbi:MFS transporter [Cyanobium sp. WAJ14-Wanaka]|uniref:MFS transporter n=1 Tax=Cyanobium sp. WAJ14-Wanaka TaxID=2823725 RepID=UPI0020CDA679|nr:MFS transporter [Cyanobium sp. WAJ14-Wanaka]MCP9774009.1 MFS transporter [Cyanobium sp. WAJ14-Wanaka]
MSPQASSDAINLQGRQRQRLLWAYGLGDAGTGMSASLIGFYLFIFYTSAAGLPAWMAGLVLMVGRLWDGVNDPIVGWLSDKTKTKLGPRLPWILGSALPLGAAMAAMWWLPPGPIGVKFAVFVVIGIVANSLYTCVNLPYSALAAELTTDVSLRTRLNTTRFTGSILASLVGIVIGALLLQDHQNPASYWKMGILTGAVVSTSTLLCGWGLLPTARACQQPNSQSGATRKLLRRVGSNGRFLRVLGLYLLLWCALQIMQTAALIYLPVVMHLPESWSNWILLPFLLSTLGGLWVWNGVAYRQGRILALRWGTGIWIGACILAMLIPPLDGSISPIGSHSNSLHLALLVLTIVLAGIGASTAYLIPWALLPDAIDADPEKPAGQYTAWMVLTQKICISLALFFFGNLMSFSGYVAAQESLQPASALLAIRLCMGLIPAILVVLGLVVMRRWPTRDKALLPQST